MRSIGLIADPRVTLDTFQAALARGGIATTGVATTKTGEQIAIEGDASYTWVLLQAPVNGLDPRAEYEPGELDAVGLERMVFYDVPYKSIALLKRVLLAIADAPRVWASFDNGAILPGPELVARLRREPGWLLDEPTVTGD